MRHFCLPCFTLVAGLAGSGCSDATSPIERLAATMVVERDTLVASVRSEGPITWMEFTVPLTISNDGPTRVSFSTCDAAIAMLADHGYLIVWEAGCSFTFDGFTTIEPGETRSIAVPVVASLEGPLGPEWRGRSLEGDYRFWGRLLPPVSSGRVAPVISNEFTLIVAPWDVGQRARFERTTSEATVTQRASVSRR